ncbi:claudin-20-like isoform X1 [Oncorhynchus masou masou]|uniref:claudin-20-like isoform X1 n=1 Tax=Oncorhynchus masou masou TaxID=90313 RepID=UPI003183157E
MASLRLKSSSPPPHPVFLCVYRNHCEQPDASKRSSAPAESIGAGTEELSRRLLPALAPESSTAVWGEEPRCLAGAGWMVTGGVGGHGRRRRMASTGMQIFAFVLALLGIMGAMMATLLPNWKVSADVGSNIITAISQMQGLWMDCTWYSTGMFSCTLKYSVLSLPAYLQTARTTMVLSCVMAAMGLCLASLGLKCTRWGGGRRAKRHAAIASGGCFIAAGFLCLVPASWFTKEVITNFLDRSVHESNKFEPGGAVYVAFLSAGFLFVGGSIFCVSCSGKRPGHQDMILLPPPDKLLLQQQQHLLQQQQQDQLQHQYCSLSPLDNKTGYSLQDYV